LSICFQNNRDLPRASRMLCLSIFVASTNRKIYLLFNGQSQRRVSPIVECSIRPNAPHLRDAFLPHCHIARLRHSHVYLYTEYRIHVTRAYRRDSILVGQRDEGGEICKRRRP